MGILCAIVVTCVQSGGAHSSFEGVTIDVDFFRAMGNGDPNAFPLENDDVAELPGVLKYIHTEVIPEHIMGHPARSTREYAIDRIVKWRFKVQNTPGLLQNAGHSVDFGPYMAFDRGQNTYRPGDDIIMSWGDYVGIQRFVPYQKDPRYHGYSDSRYPTMGPYNWVSLSGSCPNLPWTCTSGYSPRCDHPGGPTKRCPIEAPCPGKGNISSPAAQCVRYDSTGQTVTGGLCSWTDETVVPNGTHGCVYNYKRSTVTHVSLDDLAGLTSMECSNRSVQSYMCTDFYDFRMRCVDPSLKRMFRGDGTLVEDAAFCVEYDIHPACVNSCDDPRCLVATAKAAAGGPPIEVGLPFWQGRCNAAANQMRHEKVAAAFGIQGAQTEHKNTAADILAKPAKCGSRGVPFCNPALHIGGPYCTRDWSGVCKSCYIPGTVMPYPDQHYAPVCPTDVLDYPEYKVLNEPKCKSADAQGNLHAKDLCCLYVGTCQNSSVLAKQMDENGFAYAWSKGATQGLIDWFTLLVNKKYGTPYVADQKGLENVLYWKWFPGKMPMLEPSDYDAVVEQIKVFFSKPPPTSRTGFNQLQLV